MRRVRGLIAAFFLTNSCLVATTEFREENLFLLGLPAVLREVSGVSVGVIPVWSCFEELYEAVKGENVVPAEKYVSPGQKFFEAALVAMVNGRCWWSGGEKIVLGSHYQYLTKVSSIAFHSRFPVDVQLWRKLRYAILSLAAAVYLLAFSIYLSERPGLKVTGQPKTLSCSFDDERYFVWSSPKKEFSNPVVKDFDRLFEAHISSRVRRFGVGIKKKAKEFIRRFENWLSEDGESSTSRKNHLVWETVLSTSVLAKPISLKRVLSFAREVSRGMHLNSFGSSSDILPFFRSAEKKIFGFFSRLYDLAGMEEGKKEQNENSDWWEEFERGDGKATIVHFRLSERFWDRVSELSLIAERASLRSEMEGVLSDLAAGFRFFYHIILGEEFFSAFAERLFKAYQ